MNVAVVGASRDREKFGNKAVRAYHAHGHRVFPVNLREKEIEGLPAFRSVLQIPDPLDVVLVYVPPSVTLRLLPDLAKLAPKPKQLFLNPGSEDDAVIARAEELGLSPTLACSIVAIGDSPANYR
ncbi:MAG: CoA-binding protein [Candidatus Latescibacteria bacterium]|nr:CoA-binding protein [Candidatus Latescibacterota bacterium]